MLEKSPKFILFAHARSGSTSLAKALQCHQALKVAIEPFHPRYGQWNPRERSYIETIKDSGSLKVALSELFSSYNGIKILDYQLSEELYSEMLLDSQYKVILLRRRNVLQSIVSGMIAEQTGVWQISDLNSQAGSQESLQPLSPDEVSRKLKYLLDLQSFYSEIISRRPSNSYMVIEYEDFYTTDLIKNRQSLAKVFGFLALEMPRSEKLDELLDPRRAKINFGSTYEALPNAREINERFGNSKTGWLFENLSV